MSGKHRKEYWRERVQLKRIRRGLEPTKDFALSQRFRVIGEEMRRLMNDSLPWPHDLFRDHTGLQMSQPLQQQPSRNDALCICGKEHRQNVPWTRRSMYGHGFDVFYLCSAACKDKAVREFSR